MSSENNTHLRVRVMSQTDISAISHLSDQLGYPIDPSVLGSRWTYIASDDHHIIFVAEYNQKIVGWIHAYQVKLLESNGYIEIGGLVVDQEYRQKGIGSCLVSHVESWGINEGHDRIRLSSGMHRRDEAHIFYQNIGFAKRDSAVFQKNLRQ